MSTSDEIFYEKKRIGHKIFDCFEGENIGGKKICVKETIDILLECASSVAFGVAIHPECFNVVLEEAKEDYKKYYEYKNQEESK